MASTVIRRNTLQFDANVPYTLSLKYATGRTVANGRVMFTTTEDECFFLDPNEAQQIHNLRLGPQEPFELMRRVVKRAGNKTETALLVQKANREYEPRQTQPSKSQPAAVTETVSNSASQGNSNSLTALMTSAYIAAIDALLTARQYAEKKGVPFQLSEERIHTTAHSMFIEYGKTKERAIREREFQARYGSLQPRANGGGQWQR